MLAVTALLFCYGFFARVTPSVIVGDLMREFSVGAAVVGNLSAFYFYAYAGMQLPTGVALDRFGARRVITVSAAVCGLGSLLFALAETLPLAYLGRVLIGAGAACAMIGALKLASIWFPPNRFALIFGLTATVGATGAVLGQGPAAALIDVTGWREVHIGGALFVFVLVGAIWMVVRDRPAGASEAASAQPRLLHGLAVVLRNPQSWFIAITNAAMVAPLLCFGALWGVPYMMTAYGLDRPAAGLASSMMLVGHTIGPVLIGWYSDHVGRRRPLLILCASLGLASFAAVIYVPGLPLAAVYGLLLFFGAVVGASALNYASIKEGNPIAFTGVASGFVNMTTMGVSAVLQFLLGWLLDLQWEGVTEAGARVYSMAAYQASMAGLVVVAAIAVATSLQVRETWCRSSV
jgi:MFS family permease